MMSVFVFLSFLPAALGVYLIGDFFLWIIRGRAVRAKITGFQDKKDKFCRLPVLIVKDEGGEIKKVEAERIDRFLYIFNRPGQGDLTTIVVRDGPRARIFGYIPVIAGLSLWLPLIFTLAIKTGNQVLLAQAIYLLLFGVIVFGGWSFLKFIQRNY